MRAWLDIDNWFIRVSVTGRSRGWHIHRRIQRQVEALTDAIYRQTDVGELEWTTNFKRYVDTVNDKKFQSFRTLIPGLIRPKRSRKSKSRASVNNLTI